jgi:hypothetical protein
MIFSLITNDPRLAGEAEAAGIQRIMIDLETHGKAQRQAGQGGVPPIPWTVIRAPQG